LTLLALGDADAAPAADGANDCGVDGFQDGALAKSMRGYLGPPVGVAEKPLDCLRMILLLVGSRGRSTPEPTARLRLHPRVSAADQTHGGGDKRMLVFTA